MKRGVTLFIIRAAVCLFLAGVADCGPVYYETHDPFYGTREYPANRDLQYCSCSSDFCRCPGEPLMIYVGGLPPSPRLNFPYISCLGATILPRMTTAELYASCGPY